MRILTGKFSYRRIIARIIYMRKLIGLPKREKGEDMNPQLIELARVYTPTQPELRSVRSHFLLLNRHQVNER